VNDLEPRRRESRLRLALVAAAALPPLVLVAAELWVFSGRWGFPLDDSWIHLVFARNLARGLGLAFNPGTLVAGTTSPLWTALLAVLYLLPGPTFAWVQAAGIAAHLAAVDGTYRLARALDLTPRWSLVAGAFVAANHWLVWSSVSGMEIPLFIALSLAGTRRHLAERSAAPGASPPVSFVFFGLAALARPEGLLLPMLAALDRLLRIEPPRGRWRADLTDLLVGFTAVAILVVPVALFFRHASGSFLPTTFAAKSTGPPGWWPNGQYLWTAFGIVNQAAPVLALVAGGGIVLRLRRFAERDAGLLPVFWVLGMPLAYSFLQQGHDLVLGNFGRYYFPLLPFVVVLACVALAEIDFERLRAVTLAGIKFPLAALLAAAIALPTGVELMGTLPFYLRNLANVEDSDVAVAKWLAPRLDPRAVLAVNDIGAIKYLLPNPIVDLIGIATPEAVPFMFATARRDHLSFHQAMLRFVEEKKPDYLIVFPTWFKEAAKDPQRFPVLYRRPVPDNATMGGDEVVIYGTPWTRWPIVEPPPPASP
jgi:hypothetical protein